MKESICHTEVKLLPLIQSLRRLLKSWERERERERPSQARIWSCWHKRLLLPFSFTTSCIWKGKIYFYFYFETQRNTSATTSGKSRAASFPLAWLKHSESRGCGNRQHPAKTSPHIYCNISALTVTHSTFAWFILKFVQHFPLLYRRPRGPKSSGVQSACTSH